MWDTSDQRFVLWTMDRETRQSLFQTYFAVAVSKTADPTDGWHFMVVNTQTPYVGSYNTTSYFKYSDNDSPTVGFSQSHIFVTDLVSAKNRTYDGFLDSFTEKSSRSLWAFPKQIPGGMSVYESDVLPAKDGVHYLRYDTYSTLGIYAQYGGTPTRVAPGERAGNSTWLVGIGELGVQLFLVDNPSAEAGRASTFKNLQFYVGHSPLTCFCFKFLSHVYFLVLQVPPS